MRTLGKPLLQSIFDCAVFGGHSKVGGGLLIIRNKMIGGNRGKVGEHVEMSANPAQAFDEKSINTLAPPTFLLPFPVTIQFSIYHFY
jgi:hypothetical protein